MYTSFLLRCDAEDLSDFAAFSDIGQILSQNDEKHMITYAKIRAQEVENDELVRKH